MGSTLFLPSSLQCLDISQLHCPQFRITDAFCPLNGLLGTVGPQTQDNSNSGVIVATSLGQPRNPSDAIVVHLIDRLFHNPRDMSGVDSLRVLSNGVDGIVRCFFASCG